MLLEVCMVRVSLYTGQANPAHTVNPNCTKPVVSGFTGFDGFWVKIVRKSFFNNRIKHFGSCSRAIANYYKIQTKTNLHSEYIAKVTKPKVKSKLIKTKQGKDPITIEFYW
jgi:hypothetical protein